MEHEVEVEQDYAIYGDIDGEATNARAETNFVAVPKRNADEDDDKVEKTIGFVTNKDVDDEIRLDRVEAKGVVDRYRRRSASGQIPCRFHAFDGVSPREVVDTIPMWPVRTTNSPRNA